jgi:chaperonin GroEL
MAAKQILFDEEAREAIRRGVEKIGRAVAPTLGPAGSAVVIDKSWGAPAITTDGASVAEEIELEDPNEAMGARMIREAASKTSDDAGDGTTTSVVLAQAIYTEAHRTVAAGANAMQVSRGIRKAAAEIGEKIKEQAAKVGVGDRKRIVQIAQIASRGSAFVAEKLADAFAKVGKDGAVSVDEGKGIETEVKLVEGMQFDRGYLSPHFVSNPDSVTCELEDPLILVHEDKLSSAKSLIPLLEKIAQAKRPLLIIAEDVESDALATLVVNKLRGVLQVCAVKAPGYGDRRRAMLEDIAVLTGARAVFKDLGIDLEKLTVQELGRAKKAIVDADYTTLIHGAGKADAVKARIETIRREMEETDSDYDREKLQERLSRLSGGVAQVLVGAATETELKERKKMLENALSALRAAFEEGIVPGGGTALLRAAAAVGKVKAEGDESFGAEIVRRAAEAPLRTIAVNAGHDGSLVLRRVREGKGDFGFNAATGEFGGLEGMGIVDPAKVTYHALINAASVAAMLLTTDTLVSEIREKKKKPVLEAPDEDED